MKYRVKKQYAEAAPEMVTTINGKPVSLIKEQAKIIPATASGPEQRIKIPLATQAELKLMFDQGNPVIEIDDSESEK